MAARRLRPPGRSRRRPALALAGLALAMLLLHGLALDALSTLMADWQEVRPMPPRLTAAFVRTLQPSLPAAPAPAAPVRPAPPAGQAATVPAGPASAASVPETAAEANPEANPEARAEPSTAPADATPSPPEGAASTGLSAAPVASAAVPAQGAASAPPTPEVPIVALGAPSAASAPAEFQPGPEWPASTRLDYRLRGNYRGAVTGHARVEWLREGQRYQVHLEVAVGPGFAPLISRTMSSEGVLTPMGIRPHRFDEDTRILLAARRRLTLQFQGTDLVFPNGRREWAPPGVQDAASQFVQLTWLFLTGQERLAPGREIRLPLALPRRLYAWRYVIEGEETLDTPMGPLKAWHLRPVVENTGSDLRAEVWLAPSLQYLPVRLVIRQDEQTYIDLMLQAAPLQAAP